MNALREALLRGRRRPRNTGAGSPTQYRGDGYEFVELRAYVGGDDVRRIDWAATARSGELQTRVILEDVALTLAAILDDSDSMRAGRGRPLLASAREALKEWYGAASTDDRCMRVHADGVIAPRGSRGRRSALECAAGESAAKFSLSRSLDAAAATLPRGAALLVISDFFDPVDQGDRTLALLGRRFDCTALVARDPWCEGLPLRGFVTIAGAETGRTRRLFIGEAERRRYAAAVQTREAELLARLEHSNWRAELMDERNGAAALRRAFALA